MGHSGSINCQIGRRSFFKRFRSSMQGFGSCTTIFVANNCSNFAELAPMCRLKVSRTHIFCSPTTILYLCSATTTGGHTKNHGQSLLKSCVCKKKWLCRKNLFVYYLHSSKSRETSLCACKWDFLIQFTINPPFLLKIDSKNSWTMTLFFGGVLT